MLIFPGGGGCRPRVIADEGKLEEAEKWPKLCIFIEVRPCLFVEILIECPLNCGDLNYFHHMRVKS